MDRQTIHLDLCGLGVRAVKADHFLFRLLQERFDARLSTAPDYLIYSDHAQIHRLYTCKKIYCSAGSNAPDFSECDYALTPQQLDDPRHLQVPAGIFQAGSVVQPEDKSRILDFLGKIFTDPAPPVAVRRRLFGRWLLVKQNAPR